MLRRMTIAVVSGICALAAGVLPAQAVDSGDHGGGVCGGCWVSSLSHVN